MAIDTKWRGSSAGIKWVLILMLLSSFAAWIAGVAFTAKLARSGYSYEPRPSTAALFFYFAGVPMATMLAAAIDLALFFAGYLHPVVTLVWGVINWVVWAFILTFWGLGESSPDFGGIDPDLYKFQYYTDIYNTGYLYARLAAGTITAILVLTQWCLAAVAIDRARKERKAQLHKVPA